MTAVKRPRPSRLLAASLLAALATAGALTDRALVRAGDALQSGAVERARESARQAAEALRAEIAAIERDAAAGVARAGATSWRIAAPARPGIRPRPRSLAEVPPAELLVAATSSETTPSGLPVAVLAALELADDRTSAAVAERLLTGELSVHPPDLPRLAERLGAGGDPRLPVMEERLASVPASGLPRVPDFARVVTGGGLSGWARDGRDVVFWRVGSVEELLRRRGSEAVMATPADGAASEVAGVPGLRLRVEPVDAAARLARQRALSALLFVLLGALGLSAAALLSRDEAVVRRERAFLAAMTHELRTPVTAVRLLGETLAEGRGEPGEYGRLIAAEASRLEALAERALLAARTDERIRPQKVSVEEITSRAAALALPVAARRGKSLDVRTAALGDAFWDGEAVRQALSNLLDNALRHGGPHVVLAAWRSADGVTLEVSDDGPGIPRRDRRRVFGRFERGEGSAAGTGLGLWLVDRVVRAHGGRVDLVSDEGAGCRVTLLLPAANEPSP